MPTITKQVEVTLSPEDIATAFCEMDGSQQARFFNRIAEEFKKWDFSFSFQAQAIVDSRALNSGGKYIMALIGDYAHAHAKKSDEPETA